METNWKIGDVAICIDNTFGSKTTPPIKLGNKYIVNQIYKCNCGCNTLYFDIGIPANFPIRYKCGILVEGLSFWPLRAERFIKEKSLEEQKQEALEKEDYETLEKLKNK